MITQYLDICQYIDTLEYTLQRHKRTRQHIIDKCAPKEMSGINYDGMPKGNHDYTPPEVYMSELMTLDNKIKALTLLLEGYKDVKDKFEKDMAQLKGLHHAVAWRRDALGMSLTEIADELGYSIDHIRRISMQVKRTKIDNVHTESEGIC